MSNKLEIVLSRANNEPVSLSSLSVEALDSFMAVVSSLKLIAESINVNDKLTFTISEGSASCAVVAQKPTLKLIYKAMDDALKGKSENKEITGNLRKIQEQVKRPNYQYRFICKVESENPIDIHTKLISANKITIKRSKKAYEYKLRVINGYLNQIGGKDPNYHFDYGHGAKRTIVCTIEDAKQINKYLYQYVSSLLVCKEWTDPNKRDEYYHKLIIQEDRVGMFKQFLQEYNGEEDIVNKLTIMHDFIDSQFAISPTIGCEVLNSLLIGFNNKNFHLSEIKTLLVISKPFRSHNFIESVRNSLLETYKELRKL